MAQPDVRQRREAEAGDEVAAAWNLYLATTKHLSADRYENVEPRAWRILIARLRELER